MNAAFPGAGRSSATGLKMLQRMLAVAALLSSGLNSPTTAMGVEGAAPAPSVGGGTWHAVSAAEVRKQVLQWVKESPADTAARRHVEGLWPTGIAASPPADLLSHLAQTFAVVDPRAKALVDSCRPERRSPTSQKVGWMAEPGVASFLAKNLQLFYGRWLAQQLLFDEAREQLQPVRPQEVIDPPTLLFYQAVVAHALLDRDQGLDAIRLLLSRSQESPKRYVALAQLMQTDLEALKEDTLDHIARRMDDIHRRLDLGRAGPKVQQVENGVIESLDKLIKKLEDQQQQQQQAASAAAGGSQSNTPAQDSRPMEGKGPGDVVKRNIGNKSGWGNLPPKEREEAIQQVSRDFPPHYREIIEQYFRKLATEGNP